MAAYFKTRPELVERALSALGVISVGQSPSAEDVAKVDGQVDPTLSRLSVLEVVDVPNPESIALEIFDPLAAVLAQDLLTDFQVTGEMADKINLQAAKALDDLRVMNRNRPTFQPTTAEYF